MEEIKVDLKNFKVTDSRILTLTDARNGVTVAHILARAGMRFTEPYILGLCDRHGRTVGLEQALAMFPEVDVDLVSTIVCVESKETIAHRMVISGCRFTNREILKLTDCTGTSVAHEMAIFGATFTHPEILKLVTNSGRTMYHAMADGGQVFTDPEILKLTDNDDQSVKDAQDWYLEFSES